MSAFGTPTFGQSSMLGGLMLSEAARVNLQDPMAQYYAQQAAAFASRNPGNPDAQRTANYWAAIVQQQLTMMAAQQNPNPMFAQMNAVPSSLIPPPTPPQIPIGAVAAPAAQPQPATAQTPSWGSGGLGPSTGPPFH